MTVDDDISIHQIWKSRLESLKSKDQKIKILPKQLAGKIPMHIQFVKVEHGHEVNFTFYSWWSFQFFFSMPSLNQKTPFLDAHSKIFSKQMEPKPLKIFLFESTEYCHF